MPVDWEIILLIIGSFINCDCLLLAHLEGYKPMKLLRDPLDPLYTRSFPKMYDPWVFDPLGKGGMG
jgi:hypothetical protein